MKEGRELFSTYVVNCVFNVVLSCTAVILNMVTCHAIRRTSSLSKPLRTLLLSMIVSDLGVGLLVQPLHITRLAMALEEKNVPSNPIYRLVHIAYLLTLNLFCLASFLSVMALSVDRFLAIHLHLRYQELVTHKRVASVVISAWLFSAPLTLISLWSSQKVTYWIIIITQVVSVITATFLNYKIYVAVRRHAHQIHALQVLQRTQNDEKANVGRMRKSGVTSVYVYLTFLVCYLPNICILLIVAVTSEPRFVITVIHSYTMTLLFLNSSLNPLIYCWKMRHIRLAIMNILPNRILRRN